jgi:hypothetical protein
MVWFLSVRLNIISLFQIGLADSKAIRNSVGFIREFPAIAQGDNQGVNGLA